MRTVPRVTPVSVIGRAEPSQIGSVEHQPDVLGRRTGPQSVLPAIFGDRGQGSGMLQRPAECRAHVPSRREVIALFRVHIYITTMHGDHAGQLELARGDHRCRAGWDGPMGMNHVGELAALMSSLGTRDAINLDGGGSASLVCDGRLVNRPREQDGSEIAGGRPVVTALTLTPT